MNRSNLLALVSIALAASIGCADPSAAPPTATSVAAVLNGAPSTNTAVVMLTNPDESCSGFVIAPNLVLTARHCVSLLSGSGCTPTITRDYTAMEIAIHPEQTPSLLGHHVAEVILLPAAPGQTFCGDDVALVRLAAPLANVTPIEPRLDGPPAVNDPVTVVGYGQTGGGTDDPSTCCVRRERTDAHVASVSDTEWVVDEGPCFGDSGSPAIAADGRAVGVMAHGRGAICMSMSYQRVDTHADWLRSSARAAASTAGLPAPDWARDPNAGDDAAAGDAGTSGDADGVDAAAGPPAARGCAVARGGAPGRTSTRGHRLAAGLGALGAFLVLRRRPRRRAGHTAR